MKFAPEQLAQALHEHTSEAVEHQNEGYRAQPDNVDKAIAMLQANRERVGGFALVVVAKDVTMPLIDHEACCPKHAISDSLSVMVAAHKGIELQIHDGIENMVRRIKGRDTEDDDPKVTAKVVKLNEMPEGLKRLLGIPDGQE